jgi:hypothetical protein
VNANSASVKDKAVAVNLAVAANMAVAVNRVAAVSKADDKPGCLGLTGGGKRLPPLVISAHVQRS